MATTEEKHGTYNELLDGLDADTRMLSTLTYPNLYARIHVKATTQGVYTLTLECPGDARHEAHTTVRAGLNRHMACKILWSVRMEDRIAA